MTAPWVQVQEQRTESSVTFTVAQAHGIPRTLFVVNTNDDTLSHVATIHELDVLPRSKEDAEAAQLPRYLSAVGVKAITPARLMQSLILHVRLRLNALVRAWPGDITLEVPGRSVYTLPTDET